MWHMVQLYIQSVCLITALVSSQGDVINVDHLRYIKYAENGGCEIYQYYNPPVIYSDWSCEEVEESIMGAIVSGCGNI